MKVNKSTLKAMTFAMSIVALVAINGQASAASEGTVYSGIACQPSAYHDGGQLYRASGKITNWGAVKDYVTCPIANMNHTNTNGTWFVNVRVDRYYAAGSEALRCTVYSKTPTGGLVEGNTGSTTTPGAQTLYLDLDASAAEGIYHLDCDLPKYSSVLSYIVMEQGVE